MFLLVDNGKELKRNKINRKLSKQMKTNKKEKNEIPENSG